MSNNNPRQRIRRQEVRFRGKTKDFGISTEEHTVLGDDGNIVSHERTESPVAQGMIPHEPTDVVGQCQTCLNFATEKMILVCDCCWQVVCLPCASKWKNETVCPACARHLDRRRFRLIFRKLFIEPFVEWIG